MHMTTTGIVLREVNYKESDKILTVLTRDAGKRPSPPGAAGRRTAPLRR